ncbi:MAG: AAA-like domain-containing protein [Gammaproteobacteria bacterium]
MAKLIQSVEFFVVGGAVQAGRSCYIERNADQDLIDAVVGQRFAWILAPRGSGKTSLMLRASAALRGESQHTAVVDLRQIAAHGEGADPSRWFYGVAHRICRELRLKFDLQTWWQERSALNAEQRFAEFFSDIVLSQTQQPVTIFFDEVEHVSELAFAGDFFEVIRNCYALRASEPDFRRLNFVVLGSGSHSQLCPDAAISPFVIGEEIALHDFTLEEVARLQPGFELGEEAALGLLERIYSWTSGQPYLTQKLARAVARRGGRLEDVERCAQELFLATNVVHSEPQLSFVSTELGQHGQSLRPALTILRRLGHGIAVQFDSASKAQERLFVAGIARRGADGQLEITNRIYARVFDERWARAAMPFHWRGLALGTAVAALLILVPYWYVNYLPRPWIQTLTTQDIEFDSARSAWERLNRLPGFADTADTLFADVLARRARSMSTLAEVLENDALIRDLNDHDDLAERLLAEFWLRRSHAAAHAEDRDAALFYATAALDGLPEEAGRVVADLGSDEYARLTRTVNLAQPPVLWAADEYFESVTAIDAASESRMMRLFDGASTAADAPLTLTALQHTAFVRELSVDSDGSAGGFALRLVVAHPAANDLTVTLAAPSGAAVNVALAEEFRDSTGFLLDTRLLGPLADERRQGVWRLTLVDTVAGNAGVLHRWSLEFADGSDSWRGAPDAGVPIPEPVRTNEIEVALSGDGRIAVARPALEGVSGSLSVWALDRGEFLHDLRLDRPLQSFELTRDGEHLLAVAGNELFIWSVSDGDLVARIQTQTEFLLPPAVSSEGGYVAIAERVDGAEPLFSLIRISDGRLVSSITGRSDLHSWLLGPEARYLALMDGSRSISVIEPRRGTHVATLELERPVAAVVAVAHGELIVTVDTGGSVHVWQLSAAEEGSTLSDSWQLGVTSQPGSVTVAPDATSVVFVARAGELAIHDLSRQRAPFLLRVGTAQAAIRTRIAGDGSALLTQTGRQLRIWSIAERPLAESAPTELTALALGSEGRLAALGYRGGFVRAASLSDPEALSRDGEMIDYIGHRGPVTALTLNVQQNLVASGGRDGSARLWNLATLSPGDSPMNHAEGPVAGLRLSDDGGWLLVGTPDTASLWRLPEGALAAEYPVNGAAGALAFADQGGLFAIGDTTGNLLVAERGQAEPRFSMRADSEITALAFAPREDYVVSGDALGNLRVWALRDGLTVPEPRRFREPIRWLDFADAPGRLVVQTEQWLHQVDVGEQFEVTGTRLLPAGLEAGAAADRDGRWQLLGGLLRGRVEVTTVEFDAAIRAEPPAVPSLSGERVPARRAWGEILGLEFDGDGNAVPVIHQAQN